MRQLFLTLALLLPNILATGILATIQANPNTVGAISTLSMTLKLDSLTKIDPKGGIRLKTPTLFLSKIQCEMVEPLSVKLVTDPKTGSRCQHIASNEVQLTIQEGSLLPSTTVFVSITNFQNPSSTLASSGLVISVFDGSGVTTSSLNVTI